MSNLADVQRHIGLLVLAIALLAGSGGCRQEEQPRPSPVSVPQTQPAGSQPVTQPATQQQPQPGAAVPQTATTQPTRRFSVTSVGLKADQPVSLLEKVAGEEPARISAHLQTDHFLVIETSNVSYLRIDLANLPRRQGGRLVLQIDGQGLEVTGRGDKVVYLQRNSVGNWAFTKQPQQQSNRQDAKDAK